jgi:type II secretory pathway component GspD/PulD (secretin)
VGVLLKLTPHISEENQIRLKIDQQLTKVKGQTAEDKFRPTTLKRAAKTTVVV